MERNDQIYVEKIKDWILYLMRWNRQYQFDWEIIRHIDGRDTLWEYTFAEQDEIKMGYERLIKKIEEENLKNKEKEDDWSN